MVGLRSIPTWLVSLLNEKFFEPCLVHSDPAQNKKSEKNLFCFDCCTSVCPKCLFRHRKHVLLQVRRYMYNDVIKLSDAEKLMDCSAVQKYITNSAKVVYLRQRPPTRLYRTPTSGNFCYICNRSLQEPFLFCCLTCKVEHVIASSGTLRINVSDHRMLGFSDIDEFHVVTPDSVLDSVALVFTSSGSTSSTDLRTDLLCTATTEIVRKKRTKLSASLSRRPSQCVPQPPDENHDPFCVPQPSDENHSNSLCVPQPSDKSHHDSACLPQPGDYNHNCLNRRKKGVPNRSPLC